MVSRVCRVLPWLFGAALAGTVAPAQAQSNLDAGKSPAQIFSDTCNACHRSPREIKPTSAGFLREHYSTGPREAAAMAAYLASIGSDTRAVQQRKPPALGAGQAPDPAARPGQAASADPGKPEAPAGAPAAAKLRRPSDSIEAGSLPVAAGGGTEPSASPASAAARPDPAAAFEE
jgi:hypothetical protein